MRPIPHVITSLGAAGFIYVWFNSSLASILCFLSGVLFDLDHVPDYLLDKKKKFALKDFYHRSLGSDTEKIYLVFHSFELVFFLWGLIHLLQLNILWIALAFSITIHLIFDTIQNSIISPFTYFFSFRIIKKFRTNHLFIQNK